MLGQRLYQALAEHRARKQRRDSTGVQPKK
jgi:hypothetical protein